MARPSRESRNYAARNVRHMLEAGGVNFVLSNFKKFSKNTEEAAAKGLVNAGKHLLKVSQEDYVPVEFGFLKSSGTMEATGEGFSTKVLVGYFGMKYAIFVHEILEYKHPVGQAKYLETPLRRERDEMVRILGKKLEADIKTEYSGSKLL